jgi:hypothetical protein
MRSNFCAFLAHFLRSVGPDFGGFGLDNPVCGLPCSRLVGWEGAYFFIGRDRDSNPHFYHLNTIEYQRFTNYIFQMSCPILKNVLPQILPVTLY